MKPERFSSAPARGPIPSSMPGLSPPCVYCETRVKIGQETEAPSWRDGAVVICGRCAANPARAYHTACRRVQRQLRQHVQALRRVWFDPTTRRYRDRAGYQQARQQCLDAYRADRVRLDQLEKARRAQQQAARQPTAATQAGLKALVSRMSHALRRAYRQQGAVRPTPIWDQLGYTPSQLVAHLQAFEGQPCPLCHLTPLTVTTARIQPRVPLAAARTAADLVACYRLEHLRLICRSCGARQNGARTRTRSDWLRAA